MQWMLSLAILLSLCTATSTLSQKPPRPTGKITASEILTKHVAATGGQDAWGALQTVSAHGSLAVGFTARNSGDFDFYYRSPANDVFQFFMTSHGQISVGHNEGTPFLKGAAQGVFGIGGVTISSLEQSWLALTEAKFEQMYKAISVVGLEEVEGEWAYALRFFPKAGDPQVRYYDCQSFQMVRMDMVQRFRPQKDGPELAYKVEMYFSGYRDTESLKFPKQIKGTTSGGQMTLDLESVRINRPISDSVFQKK